MRAVFLFVLLANIAFFAWANFFAEADLQQGDRRPLARQIEAEKLRIVPASPGVKPAPAAAAQNAVQSASASIACLEWGALGATETTRAAELLAPLRLGQRLRQRQVEDGAGWWVFISPRGSRLDAQKKAAEIAALGVKDYFILQDEGPMRYALSLGVFKTEAAANSHLEALRALRVRTAQVGARESQAQKTWFQIRPAEDALAAKLREIALSFSGSEMRECASEPGEKPAPRPG
ncbi:MAG: hypothetical protein EXR29_00045 [Betaproteobacteria bacterium]|nr:hypothetical protein [Betaproteobacteria bacterium]